MSEIAYTYRHAATESTTGYFSCEPPDNLTLEAALKQLELTPLDTFLHRHLLRRLGAFSDNERTRLAMRIPSAILAALLGELEVLHAGKVRKQVTTCQDARHVTPLPYLPYLELVQLQPSDAKTLAVWNELFQANLEKAHPLPHPEDGDPPLPDYARIRSPLPSELTVAQVYADLSSQGSFPVWERPPSQETSMQALANLASSGVLAGIEMRHESSLSPVGLLRNWHVSVSVHQGDLAYTFQGEATTWGRGCTLADARASCSMEMVERASAYLSVADGRILDRVQPSPLRKATWTALQNAGIASIDPARLSPALPVEGNLKAAEYVRSLELYWLEGHSPSGETVLVPAQTVGLFWNLDEPELCSAPGSTGLASGNTMDEAKVAALTEIIERDAEATVPWRRESCFELIVAGETAEDVYLAALLDGYQRRGIHVRFRDMTTEFGLPCYQSYVIRQDGSYARGTGAGLSGRCALLSALTETPYPYPNGPVSAPPPQGLPRRQTGELPEYRLESPARNLLLLETVLAAHGHTPVYVPLTREDLVFPVVRAIVPDVVSVADFDRFSRPSSRLFARYLGKSEQE